MLSRAWGEGHQSKPPETVRFPGGEGSHIVQEASPLTISDGRAGLRGAPCLHHPLPSSHPP